MKGFLARIALAIRVRGYVQCFSSEHTATETVAGVWDKESGDTVPPPPLR